MKQFVGLISNKETIWGLSIVGFILILGILVPLISPFNPISSSDETLSSPNFSHWFGTDQLGRDIFTRTFFAVKLDISLALIGVSAPLMIGTFMGAVIGTTRNPFVTWFWTVVIDAINAFPFIVLVIAIVAIIGPGVRGLLIGLTAVNWARYAKMARARAAILREAEFIQATQVLGYSRMRVLIRHILPNVYTETLAYGLSDFVIVIITISALSFLGAGIRPPTPEWGAMMADGRIYLQRQWWITVFPGLVLSLTAIGVALLAQGFFGRYAVQEK
ncbi:MAG: ABC transporter permease [Anaerolineales bacterium]|jgi:peptide/nickel transport system permease protein